MTEVFGKSVLTSSKEFLLQQARNTVPLDDNTKKSIGETIPTILRTILKSIQEGETVIDRENGDVYSIVNGLRQKICDVEQLPGIISKQLVLELGLPEIKFTDEFSMDRLRAHFRELDAINAKIHQERMKCKHVWGPESQNYNIYSKTCSICGHVSSEEY